MSPYAFIKMDLENSIQGSMEMGAVSKQEERVVIAPDWENMIYAVLGDPSLAPYPILDVIIALTLQLEILATRMGKYLVIKSAKMAGFLAQNALCILLIAPVVLVENKCDVTNVWMDSFIVTDAKV